MLSGLYLSTIHPRYYAFWFDHKQYTLKSWDRFFIELIHISAFIFIASKYKFMPDPKFALAVGLICAYSLVINPKDIYYVNRFELLSVMTCATLLYVILYSQK